MIAQTDLSLTMGHPLSDLLQQRVVQLESERAALQREITLLKEQLLGPPSPQAGRGATQARVQQAREAVHGIGAAIHQETRFTLRAVAQEQARVRDEVQRVLAEGRELMHLLTQALEGLQRFAEQIEGQATGSLHRAQRRQEALLAALEQLERPDTPLQTIAQRRQAAFRIQQRATAATVALEQASRSTRDTLSAESQALWQVSHSLQIAMAHVNRHAQALSALTALGSHPPFAELLTAPRPALDSAEALVEAASLADLLSPLQRVLRRWAILPLLSLLLSSSLAARGYSALPPNPQSQRDESSRRAIARITMRHWLKDLNPTFRPAPEPATTHLAPGDLAELRGEGGRWASISQTESSLAALDLAALVKSTARPRFPQPTPEPTPEAAPLPEVSAVPVAPAPRTHRVQQGETVSSIARRYGLRMDSIVRANPTIQSNPHRLNIGQTLLIPTTDEGIPAASFAAQAVAMPAASVVYDSTFIWPTQGRVTQQPSAYHMALDIAAPLGTPILAASGGTVEVAGWDNSGYGYMIVIDHGNGFRTRYAHLSAFHVEAGNVVSQGTHIGNIGSTGRSTGPHLHFEIIRQGVLQNPWNYLSS